MAQLLLTSQPLWLVFLGVKLWERMQKRREKKEQNAEKKQEQLEKACYNGPYVISNNNGDVLSDKQLETKLDNNNLEKP